MDEKTQIYQRLKQAFRGRMLLDELMSEHTYFRIGGPADYYLYPKDLEDLTAVMDFCQKENVPRFIIGNGSNLLVADEGFRGVIIDLSETFDHLQSKGLIVTVGSGVVLGHLIKYCRERGLSGLETLMGIPGQVGGALVMNAGAYGGEISDRLHSVRLLDQMGTMEVRQKAELEFGYRASGISSNSVVVEAQFFMAEGNPKEMEERQLMFQRKRRQAQPLSLPSAGSVFKRPEGDYAGRLIEETGCKGLRIGDAMVSKKHANFIVNCHLARAQDVVRVIDEVRERVLKRFEVALELEIVLVGIEA